MIQRSKLTENFTTIPNDIAQKIENPVAIGVLVYLLSLPLDWVVYKTHLYKHFKAGRKRIDDAFTELEELGYIVKVQKINEKGQFDGVEYICYNLPVKPDAQLPTDEKPIVEKPTVGKQATTKEHNTQKTHNTKNKEYKTKYILAYKDEIIEKAKELYPDKNVEKAMNDFIDYITNTKNISWIDYRKSFYNWVGKDKFNQYAKPQTYKRLN